MSKPTTLWKIGKGMLFAFSAFMLGLLCVMMRMLSNSEASGWGAGLIMVVLFLFAVFFLFIIARLVAPIIAGWISRKYAQDIFYSGNNTREAPPEFAELRAMIVRGDINEAMKRLQAIREEEPKNSYVVNLMAEVYLDITHDYENAAIILTDFLKKKNRSDSDVGFVMKLVDVYLESNADEKAADLLKNEIQKKYSPNALEKLKKRLIWNIGSYNE